MDRGLWHCTGDRDQDHPQEKEMQKSKMAVWGGLTNNCEKKRSKKQRREGKIHPFEYRVQKLTRRDKKAFLSDQWKEIEENNRLGKSRPLFKIVRNTKGTFHAKLRSIKDRWYRPNKSRRYQEEVARIHRQTVQKRSSRPRSSRWCDHSPRARHAGMWSQVGLRKHHYE